MDSVREWKTSNNQESSLLELEETYEEKGIRDFSRRRNIL